MLNFCALFLKTPSLITKTSDIQYLSVRRKCIRMAQFALFSGEDTPDKVKLKTQAYKTCNNTKELARVRSSYLYILHIIHYTGGVSRPFLSHYPVTSQKRRDKKGVRKRAFLVENFLGQKCSVVCCVAQQILIDINKCFTSTLEKISF